MEEKAGEKEDQGQGGEEAREREPDSGEIEDEEELNEGGAEAEPEEEAAERVDIDVDAPDIYHRPFISSIHIRTLVILVPADLNL